MRSLLPKHTLSLAFSLLILTTSCSTVGPHYNGPPVTVAIDEWAYKEANGRTVEEGISQWWRKLNDPTLNSLIDRATHNNFNVKVALSRIQENEARYGVANSQRYPTVNALAGASRSKSGDASEAITGLPARTDSLQDIGGALNWEIDLFGRISRQIETSQAQYDFSVNQYRDVLVSLNAEVTRTYADIRSLQLRLVIAKNNVQNQLDTLRLARSRYKAELVSELDVIQAKQNLRRSQSTMPLLQAALNRSINRLSLLLGEAPGALKEDLKDIKPLPALPEALTLVLPREVIRQRPDIRMAERQLAAQTAQIGVITADLYPRLSLRGLFGLADSSGGVVSDASSFWVFGPQLSWNVFDAKRAKNRIEIANKRAEQARFAYEQTVLSAFSEVESSLSDYHEERKRKQFLIESSEAAKKSVKLAKTQYRSGLRSFQSVLDAERQLFVVEDELVESRAALMRHFVAIYRAMGGGWQTPATETASNKPHQQTNHGDM